MDRDDSTPCAAERDDVRGAASDPTATKKCSKCGVEKPRSEFYNSSRCKPCHHLAVEVSVRKSAPRRCPFSASMLEELYEIQGLSYRMIADRASEYGPRVYQHEVRIWLDMANVRVRNRSEATRLAINKGRKSLPENIGGRPANLKRWDASHMAMLSKKAAVANHRRAVDRGISKDLPCLMPGCSNVVHVYPSLLKSGKGLYCSRRCFSMDIPRRTRIGPMPASFSDAYGRDDKPLSIAIRDWFAHAQDDVPITSYAKICSKCRKLKMASEFYRSHRYSSGLNLYCKQCARAVSAKSRSKMRAAKAAA